MPTTSNFGWTTPADTDLVKDGAAAIRTLGNGIDTSLVDLKGGTTGQVLSKNSNTDLDFTWVAQDDSNAIQNAIVDAKGDLISATAADTPARLASSGVNGDILTVDTSTATGLKWATPTGSNANWSLLNAGGTSLSGGQTVTVSGISGKNAIMILVDQASSDAATSTIQIRLNGDTGTNYYNVGSRLMFTSAYSANNLSPIDSLETGIIIGRMSNTASSVVSGYVLLNGCNTAGVKVFNCGGTGSPAGSNDQYAVNFGGYYSGSSTISSVSVFSSSGNLDGGLIYIYTTA